MSKLLGIMLALVAVSAQAQTSVPTCRPSLAVGDLPVRGCVLFAKYGSPDCGELPPTWHISNSRSLTYWTLPLAQIEGPNAFIASPNLEPGVITVTVTAANGANRTGVFEVLSGGSCVPISPRPSAGWIGTVRLDVQGEPGDSPYAAVILSQASGASGLPPQSTGGSYSTVRLTLTPDEARRLADALADWAANPVEASIFSIVR